MTHLPRRSRRGFTLLELLTVLAIIGILVTLTTGAVFRLRNARLEVTTSETLEKLQGAWEQQHKAALDTIRKEEVPPVTLQLATSYGGDAALAKVMHLKFRLRQEFPDRLTDIDPTTAGFQPTGDAGLDAYLPTLRATYRVKSTYSQPNMYAALATGNLQQQNAALLFLAFSKMRGGAGFDAEAIGSNATGTLSLNNMQFKIFRDSWDKPIGFVRQPDTANWATVVGELNDAPYIDLAKQPVGKRDSYDPDGKLFTLSTYGNATPQKTLWNGINFWIGSVNDGLHRRTVIFSAGLKSGFTEGDEFYGFRIKGTGKGN